MGGQGSRMSAGYGAMKGKPAKSRNASDIVKDYQTSKTDGVYSKHITQDTFKNMLRNISPNKFVGTPEDSTLDVGGVKFNYLWTNKLIDSKGNTVYSHDYQSEKQDSTGQYVLAKVKVIEKRSKKGIKYEYDMSSIGSRLY